MSITRAGGAFAALILLGAGCVGQPPSTVPSDTRLLLSAASWADSDFEDHYSSARTRTWEAGEGCGAEFTQAAPTETASFSDSQAGFSAEVPFNPAWGDERYRIAPYQLDIEHSRFYYGPLRAYSMDRYCSWNRPVIYLLPPRTADEEMKDIRGEAVTTGHALEEVGVRRIGETDVVDATYAEVAGVVCHKLVALGKKYDYSLMACGDLPAAENLLRTMKLID